ncbi:MAG TPA: aspartyl protease family protein [Candidatus Elarobacter sp.]|jgi:hypothetical protein
MLTALAAAWVLAAAAPPQAACDAAALFAAVRARTGGARWNRAAELVAEGTIWTSGLLGPSRSATDLRSGATASEDGDRAVRTRLVSSASVTWKRDATRGVHPLDSPDQRAAARTRAYLARNGWFAPATDPASFACLPNDTENGAPLRRVRIVPRGGRPVTVWIDPAAMVVVRTQQQAPTQLDTTSYGAYRRTAGLLLPHEIVATDDRPEDTEVRSVRAYRVLDRVRQADFARPHEPSNQRIAGGATSTEVPLEHANGSPVVNAYVNGRGPLPFILDTGGHAILTAEAARDLGLSLRGNSVSGGAGEGTISVRYAPVRSLRLGHAELSDIPMIVIPYGKDFSDRGAGKPPLAGILGAEIFERYAVTLDYARGALRLQAPRTFTPHAGDVAVPIVFQEDMPLAYASADGVRGLFGIDTGNSGRVVLFGDFLRQHRFAARYPAGIAQQGTGTGGVVRTSAIRLRAFSFGGLTMHDFVTGLADQRKGAFSSRTEAGNLGYDVLSHFTVTFDYGRGRMYLRPEPNAPVQRFNRTGLTGITRDAQGRIVMQAVFPNSPAADAGLAPGDVLLEIGGTPTEHVTSADLYRLNRGAPGTAMRLRVSSRGAERDVTLILRELLCNSGSPCTPSVTRNPPSRGSARMSAVNPSASARRSQARAGPRRPSAR